MKVYYFVGGPMAGKENEFFARLNKIGGTPSTWQIYPYAATDGQALHICQVETLADIQSHLEQFDDIYEHRDFIEIKERP